MSSDRPSPTPASTDEAEELCASLRYVGKPYRRLQNDHTPIKKMMIAAADLIEQQRQEIERLREPVPCPHCGANGSLMATYEQAIRADEREKADAQWSDLHNRMAGEIGDLAHQLKTERGQVSALVDQFAEILGNERLEAAREMREMIGGDELPDKATVMQQARRHVFAALKTKGQGDAD